MTEGNGFRTGLVWHGEIQEVYRRTALAALLALPPRRQYIVCVEIESAFYLGAWPNGSIHFCAAENWS